MSEVDPARAFQLFGPGHLAALALTVAVPLMLILLAKRGARQPAAWSLAAVLVLNKIVVLATAASAGRLSLENGLPMHLCDWATVTAVIALCRPTQLLFELTYFWGLAGTLQAVLTPDLRFGFSDPGAWFFFISHSGVIAAAVFLAGGFGLRPAPRSIVRVFGWSQVYLVVTLAVNFITGANYGYLSAKPAHPSLLDYLGPWPFYILSLETLALVLFALCYAPFFVSDRLAARRG